MIKIEDGDYCKTCKLVDKYNELEKENNELSKMCELYSNSLYNAELKQLKERIDKAIDVINLIKPELWNISNKMTYKLIDIKNILKGDSNEKI